MDDDTLVKKLGLGGGPPNVEAEEEPAYDSELDIDAEGGEYRPYIVSRQAGRPSLMLGLSFRNGGFSSLSYSHLYQVSLNGDQIELVFTEHRVEVKGIRLRELYRRLQQQRVLEIMEADRPTAELSGEIACIVLNLRITPAEAIDDN